MSVPGGDKYTFPNLTDAPTAAVCVPIPIIPFFRDFFAHMQQRGLWQTRDDWLKAYRIFGQIEAELMGSCIQDLIESNNRLYRLLDTALNGTQYTATPDGIGGITILPQIADAPPASVSAPNAMRSHIGRLWHLVENLTSGTTYAADAGVDGAPALPDAVALRDVFRRLIAGIDGGAEPPATNLVELLDQAETLLAEIRDKLV